LAVNHLVQFEAVSIGTGREPGDGDVFVGGVL
jgi:hypothetical protein